MNRLVAAAALVALSIVAPVPRAEAAGLTMRDLQECPEFADPLADVEFSADSEVAAVQTTLAQQGFSDTTAEAAWAMRLDPLQTRLVQQPPPNIAGSPYHWAAIGGLSDEERALVADHGTTATRWRIVVTNETDAEIIRSVVAADPLAEVVVEPNRVEVREAWSQLRLRTAGWRDGSGRLTPGHWRTRSLPPVDSPPWGVIGHYPDEIDRDIDWLVEGLDLSVVCRAEIERDTPTSDTIEGDGWRFLTRHDLGGAHFAVFDADPGDQRWGPDADVDFETEVVVEVRSYPAIRRSDATFDGINLATHGTTASTSMLAIAVDRDLIDPAFVVRVNNEIAGAVAFESIDGAQRLTTVSPDDQDAPTYGFANPEPHDAPFVAVVDAAASPRGGVWRIDLGGALYATAGAPYLGSMGGITIDEPMVAITPTPSGDGYWMVAGDGGVFSFGDAEFFGSIPGVLPHGAKLASPIVGIETTPSGLGYWLVAGDGGVFTFGDAEFHGSVPALGTSLADDPAVGIAAAVDGYWVATASGRVFSFGEAPTFDAPSHLADVDIVVTDIVGAGDGMGYRLERGSDFGLPFGSAIDSGEPALDMLRCPTGNTPTTLPPRTPIRTMTFPADLATALRESPDLAGGHWLNRGEVATDVVGNRQAFFGFRLDVDPATGQPRGSWFVYQVTTCEPDDA